MRRALHPACLVLGLVLIPAAAAPRSALAQAAVQARKPPTILAPADAEQVFTALLRQFFQAYTAKDIEAMAALWHPTGPARSRRNIVLVEFDTRRIEMAGLIVRNAAADPGGGRARAILDLTVTDAKTGKSRRERRVRDFTFLQDSSGTWKIWNEMSPWGELAHLVIAVPPAERDAFIASQPEYASDDTLTGLTNEAGNLQSQGKFEQVLDVLATQARLARTLGNQDALGRSLIQAGSLRMMTGRYPEANEAFSAARETYASTGNTEEVAACDANLANLSYIQGRFAEAVERYQRAFEVFERMNDDARMASTLHGLGNALYMQTEFSKALEYYTRAITVLQRTKDKYAESNVLQALAMVHKELGDYAPAAEAWRKSLAITEAGGDRTGTAKAYAGLGEIYRLQGDLARALEHQMKALAIWEQLRNLGASAAARFAIGQLYALERNFPRALESYEKALAIDLSITDDAATSESGQARELGGMAGAHFALNQPDVALGEYERSLALREKLKDEPGVMWTLAHMGVLHASQQRPEEAAKAYERSLSIAEAKPDRNAVSTVLALRAQLELDQDHAEAALASAARAAETALAIEHFDTVMYAKVVTGRAYQKAGKTTEARAAFEEAVTAVGKIPVGPAAETFFDNRRAPFVGMVDLLAGQGNGSEAFRWSERARLDALAEMLGGDGAIVLKGLSPEERDQERAVAKDLRALNAGARRERGRQKPDAERLAGLQKELAAKQAERDALRRRLYEAHPELRPLRAQDEPVEPEAAATALGAAPAAIVSFVLTEARTWVFALGKDAATGAWGVQKVVPIDVKAADLGQQVRQFREAIGKKEERAEQLGRELHSRLLEPVQAVLAGKSRLVVVPDAFLWSLPFEALQTPGGRFLVEDVAVSYVPSVTALAAFAAAVPAATGPRTLVTLGQPVIAPAQEERLALLRPGARTAAAAAPASATGTPPATEGQASAVPTATPPGAPTAASASAPSAAAPSAAPTTATRVATPAAAPAATPRPSAPSARTPAVVAPPSAPASAGPAPAGVPSPRQAADPEVQAFSALFAPTSRKVFVGDQARPDRLAGIPPGALLHLAIPTVLAEGAPLYSTLAFTPTDSTDPSSGLVEAYALMFASIPAELVVASRVEYGPASGEGEALTALAWMFLVGGAPSLVLDRWVGGPKEPNVAVRFARAHVATGGTASTRRPSDSLRKAMTGILSQPATRHPYYWAGYLVIGR